jgi:LacI family transcriptional regulator
MGATLLDIAKRLNISVATVSRALNDRPGVGSDLRQRVIATAAELGFVPNMAARSLVTSRTQTVGFVIHPFGQPFSSDPFYFPILMAVEVELVTHDYHIMLTSLNSDSPTNLRMVEQSRVDGLILVGPNLSPQFVTTTLHRGFPVVLIDNKPGHLKANTILSDNAGGAYEATMHLAGHGHTRIAHIGGPLDWVSNRQRYSGYCAALRDAGLKDRVLVVHKEGTTIATGEQAAAELLDGPEPPTAIFAANDSMALGAARAAAARGLIIPGDLALIGFDNISAAEHFSPPLTTVRIFKEQIGKLAARRILELIDDPDIPPVETSVSTELVVRQSCGCP